MRAVARNFSAGGIRQGFSTITMQVAHNSFLADRYHGRSLRRKLVELRISRLLERELTKDQILEHYLNVIYLGNGVNGIEAASLDLFGKSVDKLTLPEGALLAGAAEGAVGLHAAAQSAARGAAPQPRARSDGRSGLHHRGAGAVGDATPAAHRRERVAAVDHERGERAGRGARDRRLGRARRAQGRRRQRLHDARLHAPARGRPHDAAPHRRRSRARRARRWAAARGSAGRARRARSDDRRHPRARSRQAHAARRIQSRVLGAPPTGVGVQAVRLRGGARGGLLAGDRSRRRSGRSRRWAATSGSRRTTTTSTTDASRLRAR